MRQIICWRWHWTVTSIRNYSRMILLLININIFTSWNSWTTSKSIPSSSSPPAKRWQRDIHLLWSIEICRRLDEKTILKHWNKLRDCDWIMISYTMRVEEVSRNWTSTFDFKKSKRHDFINWMTVLTSYRAWTKTV